MDVGYLNTVDQAFHPEWTTGRLHRLDLVRRSVAALWPDGHPTRMVQVAGTSGKGSTCSFIEAGLGLSGTAGAYLSPHVFDYRERFSIDGSPAPADAVTAAWDEVVLPRCQVVAEGGAAHSFSEVAILLALVLFDRFGVTHAAIETGVGGRYDQTTALAVAATAITNVGEDHLKLLGDAPWQRALDKAGIARPDIPLFTTERTPETLEVIAGVARGTGSPFQPIGPDADIELDALTDRTGLLAMAVQRRNAALALAVLRYLDRGIDAPKAVAAMGAVEIPGRLTSFPGAIIGDIAHNPDEIAALVAEVTRRSPGGKPVFVVGVSGDRDPVQLLHPIMEAAAAVVVTESGYRGRSAKAMAAELAAAYPESVVSAVAEPRAAVTAAGDLRKPGEPIVVTGSTYVVDEALNPDPRLARMNAMMGWRTPLPEPGKGP